MVGPNPGMSAAVAEAMKRRVDDGMMSQTSPDARMQQNVPQPVPPTSMPIPAGQPVQVPNQPPKFTPQTSKDMLVMALIDQLKNENKAGEQSAAMGGGSGVQDYVSNKIPKLMNEGYTAPGQAYAVARSMYNRK